MDCSALRGEQSLKYEILLAATKLDFASTSREGVTRRSLREHRRFIRDFDHSQERLHFPVRRITSKNRIEAANRPLSRYQLSFPSSQQSPVVEDSSNHLESEKCSSSENKGNF